MKILLLEPFFTGSHAAWAEGFAQYSSHKVQLLTLPGRYWKWRMYGAAVTLAEKMGALPTKFDLLLASDMLDLSTFLALTRQQTAEIPTVIYFHENQLTYPWSPSDADVKLQRDNHYSFINYTSALAADRVFFNSHYHQNSFLDALSTFLQAFPDHKNLSTIKAIEAKSKVWHLGMDLQKFDIYQHFTHQKKTTPLILWNHRWEYDKCPELFFKALFQLAEQGLAFEVAILGERFKQSPGIFLEAKKRLGSRIVQFAYASEFSEYAKWLWQADILPVTSVQDFFGGSIVQAMYCNTYPILPNRLAYPEHLPNNQHKTHLYNTFDELVEKLAHCLKNIEKIRATPTQQWVKHYNWQENLGKHNKLLFF